MNLLNSLLAEGGLLLTEKNNWYKKDDVLANSMFGFDYCFCGGDCSNVKCGRNYGSKSYKAMRKSELVYSCSDFTKDCKNYHKPKKVAE